MRLTAEYVYTSGASGVIKNGYVEFDEADGTIVSVGECSADEQITPGALTPGFVNGHCHIELSHLHGKFRKGTGMAGFIDQILTHIHRNDFRQKHIMASQRHNIFNLTFQTNRTFCNHGR